MSAPISHSNPHPCQRQKDIIHILYTKGLACLLVLTTLMHVGCTHTYPSSSEEPVNPTNISADLVFQFSEKWEYIESAVMPESELTTPPSRSETWPRRLWVELKSNSGRAETLLRKIGPDELTEGSYRLNVSLRPERYTVTAWSDYLDPETSEPLGYNITQPNLIRELRAHGDETESRMCLCANDVLDLSALAGKWDQTTVHSILLEIPVARFRLIADDYSDFLDHTEEARKQGEKYYVELIYDSEIPGGFSIYDSQAMDPVSGCSFSYQLPIITMPGVPVPCASDWLFTPVERYTHTVTLNVYNSAKIMVSQTKGISFPVERGKLTTVTGNFLTGFITGGIQVDNLWSDEISIKIE